MKAFMADVKDKVAAAIAVEGMKVNRIIHVAVGSRRYKVTFTARGGHSWGHFPSPSAIHIMGRAIADISRLEVPTDPKTTYNVGVIHGGTTVNTIAAEADMLVDMRSIDANSLADLEKRVLNIVERAAKEGDGQVKLELVGDRPAGAIPADHPVVQTCMAIHRAIGLKTYTEPGSTDHSVPLVDGTPRRVPLGYGRGQRAPTGRVHRDRADPDRGEEHSPRCGGPHPFVVSPEDSRGQFEFSGSPRQKFELSPNGPLCHL